MTDSTAPVAGRGGGMTDAEKTARLRRLLRQRHLGANGKNGDAWAYFEEVRNGTGFARLVDRTADALAMSLWPSRGLELHGFEIKVSRADWLRELREPAKADDFVRHSDRWWLVTEPDVVEDGELPPTWGHLVRRGSKLVQATAAPELDPEPMDRRLLASILRSAAQLTEATPEQITEALNAERDRLAKIHSRAIERERAAADELRRQICDFEQAAGVRLDQVWPVHYGPADVGAAVRLVLQGDAEIERAERRLARLAKDAESLAESIRRILPQEAAR